MSKDVQEFYRGALLGMAVANARAEAKDPECETFPMPAETQVTLLISEALLCYYAAYVESQEKEYFEDWFEESLAEFDNSLPANMTFDAVMHYTVNYTKRPEDQIDSYFSLNYGTAIGLFVPQPLVYEFSKILAETFDDHDINCLVAASLASIIGLILAGYPISTAVYESLQLMRKHDHSFEGKRLNGLLVSAVKAQGLPKGMFDEFHSFPIRTPEAILSLAVYYALHFDMDYETAIRTVNNRKTGSVLLSSIVGLLMGANLGAAYIPSDWRKALCCRDEVVQMADDLYIKYESTIDWHHRYGHGF